MKFRFLLSLTLLLGLLASPSYAAFTRGHVALLLDSADVVCYAQVVSVRPHPMTLDADSQPPTVAPGAIATVQVIGSIKGKVPSRIDIGFRRPQQMVPYTGLTQGESSIVFLWEKDEGFRFVDELNGKLEVPPHPPLKYQSPSPRNRMIAELMAAAQKDRGAIRLICLGQLGSFDSPVAATFVRGFVSQPDMALQGVARTALIQLGYVPQVDHLVKFFKRRDDTRSEQRFGTTRYNNVDLKASILVALADQFNTIYSDYNADYPDGGFDRKRARTSAQKWKNFDMIAFLRAANRSILAPRKPFESMANVCHSHIADLLANQVDVAGRPAYLHHSFRKGSRPLAIQLLNHRHPEVNTQAARAIDLMIAEKHTFAYSLDMKYVRTVREWIRTHPQWAKQG